MSRPPAEGHRRWRRSECVYEWVIPFHGTHPYNGLAKGGGGVVLLSIRWQLVSWAYIVNGHPLRIRNVP